MGISLRLARQCQDNGIVKYWLRIVQETRILFLWRKTPNKHTHTHTQTPPHTHTHKHSPTPTHTHTNPHKHTPTPIQTQNQTNKQLRMFYWANCICLKTSYAKNILRCRNLMLLVSYGVSILWCKYLIVGISYGANIFNTSTLLLRRNIFKKRQTA